MRTLLKIAVIAAVVLGVTALLGLFVMSSLARIDGVKSVPIPEDSYVSGLAANADYADAYRVEMDFCPFRNIDDVAAHAFERGNAELRRSENEVVYEGVAPGLRYNVAYLFDRNADPAALTVCTLVNYETRTGRMYFSAVKFVHRMGVPYLVERMSKETVQ